MPRGFLVCFVVVLVTTVALASEPPGDWVKRIHASQLLWSTEEPSDPAFMPAIANGNIATVVGSNVTYIAGVYNGFLELSNTSHRAAVPVCPGYSIMNGQLFACALDVENGAYYRRVLVNGTAVEQVWYAHSAYPQLLVHAIRNLNGSEAVVVEMNNTCSNFVDTSDFNLTVVQTEPVTVVAGSTISAETPDTDLVRIGVAFQYPPSQVTIQPNETVVFLIVMHSSMENISSSPEDVARDDYAMMTNMSAKDLWHAHTAAWQQLTSSRIEIEGHEYLAAAINASHYALLSNLNSSYVYGISPGGIATNAYNGHVFWDSETWMYPPQLLLHPQLARSLLQYRVDRTSAAAAKAQSFGFAGLMFPWESSATGVDTCPWALGLEYEHHISGDISFAMRQYWYATGDVEWLRNEAWPVVSGVAEFWASRATPAETSNSSAVEYGIDMVIPPDEHAGVVNNSIYTNAVAAISLQWAIEVAKILNETVPDNYSVIASALRMPFDADSQRHLEYDSYVNGSVINQADVALLQYPLSVNFSYSIAVNDLSYWQNMTDPNGYFTGDSSYAIGWLRLGNQEQGFAQFNKSFDHLQPPFNVWNERVVGGHPHFITGAGGFLQSVMFGYGGLWLTESALLIVNPVLPMKAHAVIFRNLHYMGATFTIRYNSNSITVQQTSNPPAQTPPLYFVLIASGGERWGLGLDWRVDVGIGNISIVTSSRPGARPPNWYIILLIIGGVLGVLGIITLLTLVVRTVSGSDRQAYEPIVN